MEHMEHEVDVAAIEKLAEELVVTHRRFLRSLVEARKKAGLSQAQVAERMATSQPNVSAFERYDANPTLSTVRRYALAVGARLRADVLESASDAEWRVIRGGHVVEAVPSAKAARIEGEWVSVNA